ncbi:hypothetical protein [Clostridium manihotivorum]|uniref:ABC-2 type transport system permease protein n=1 Tax=Clostridium manihotivorum TaxID=2320868 RepID=A0A410DZ64_9CLOT|nr:hypothetical protein [Clostridium manihotivorum]QAA34353.1 hypothetical protein C1I91_23420 [Clostridium manihotivorum]
MTQLKLTPQKQLVSLIKTNVRSKLNLTLGEEGRGGKLIKAVIFIIFAISCMEISFARVFNTLHTSRSEILMLNSIINIQLFISSLLMLKQIITTFYLASDWKEMIIFPIKPGKLLFSKAVMSYLYNSLVSILVVVFLFSYGILEHVSINYYLQVFIYQIIITAVPVVYITLITLTIFWVVAAISNRKATWKIDIWLILVDIAVMILTYFLMKSALINHIVFNNLLLYSFFKESLSKALFINYFIAMSIITISSFGFYKLGEAYASIMKSEIFASKASEKSEVDTSNYDFRPKNTIISNVIRDLKVIIQIPSIRFNCITFNFMYSIIGAIGLLVFRRQISNIIVIAPSLKPFLLVLWLLSFQIGNATMITSFSREGRSLTQLKVFPVEKRDFLLAKFIVAMLTNIIVFISSNVLIMVFYSNFLEFLLLEVIAVTYIIGMTIILIQLDIENMSLNWVEVKDLFSAEHIFKVLKPYFILTLLPLIFIVMISSIFKSKLLLLYLSPVFLLITILVYAGHSFRKLIAYKDAPL